MTAGTLERSRQAGGPALYDWSHGMADEPTPGELSRRFDGLDRRLDALAEAVAKLPSADLVAAQLLRMTDRVTAAERDISRAMAAIDALGKSLEAERDARKAAVDAERVSRDAAIAAEKERTSSWVKLLAGGVLAAMMTGLSKFLGWSG